ncbi:unannotated protein [freshwater metagenome]|uniref:Unannotated protein n=1 Tax=freshwater metagenome TaxID=449393 RepID=A0A6J6F8H3_9ZZZZ
MVTEVDKVFPSFEGVLANNVEGQHRLDALAVARLQRGETEFARVARVDDSAGEGRSHTGRNVNVETLMSGTDRTDGVGNGNRDGVGLTRFEKRGALGETNSLLFDNLVGREFGLVSHSAPSGTYQGYRSGALPMGRFVEP